MEYDHYSLNISTWSPSAYETIPGFGILQLPGVSMLKSFTSFNIGNWGFNEEQIAYVHQPYDKMTSEKKAASARVLFWEAFDEVKVGLKVCYHTKTGKFVGLAMNVGKLGSPYHVYQTLQPNHKVQKAS